MYVGGIVAVGRTRSGRLAAMYRVSSRQFPNRMPMQMGRAVAVVPMQGFESDVRKSPYIAYNCLRLVDSSAVVGNGTHTDPIAEKLTAGMGVRETLSVVLSALDFERDDYSTPRIAGVVDAASGLCALATVRRDALLVQQFKLEAGTVLYLATYECDAPGRGLCDQGFDAATAEETCRYVLSRASSPTSSVRCWLRPRCRMVTASPSPSCRKHRRSQGCSASQGSLQSTLSYQTTSDGTSHRATRKRRG